jgi:hypothetical protein
MSTELITPEYLARFCFALAQSAGKAVGNYSVYHQWDLVMDETHVRVNLHHFDATVWIGNFKMEEIQHKTSDELTKYLVRKWPEIFGPKVDPIKDRIDKLHTELAELSRVTFESFKSIRADIEALVEEYGS